MRTAAVSGRGVRVSELGFGAASIGNLYHAVDDATARGAVDAAWEVGMRYFDTAPHYGLGLSERRLGEALAGRPRAEFVVSTKVGRLLEPDPDGAGHRDREGFDVPASYRRRWDFSRDGVRRSLDESLARLALDRVEIVFLHDPDDHWKPAVTEGYPALHELREQGVVGAIGAGMNQWEMLADFVRETDIDVIMLAGRYTLLEQPALDDLLPLCTERGVAVLAVGVFNSGLLAAPRPRSGATYNYDTAPPELVARAGRIADVCERHGVTLPQAALAFPLAHPAVAGIVVGAGSPQHVRANAELLKAPIPAQLWQELVAEGLLRAEAPVPGAA
jgi:D-threo-aldose 1-dehydrogenase